MARAEGPVLRPRPAGGRPVGRRVVRRGGAGRGGGAGRRGRRRHRRGSGWDARGEHARRRSRRSRSGAVRGAWAGYRQIAGVSLNAGTIPERPYHGRPMHPLLGSIPSPSSGNLGPFHMYGVILAVGVLVAVYVAEQRWRRRGYPRDGIYDISFWVVIWGVIGARLYHVVTDYQLFEDDPLRAFADLARRAQHLGRGARRRDRGDRHHPAPAHAHARGDGLHGPGHRARAGHRPLGQLLQPGAVREAVDAPVGTRDRAVAPSRRLCAVRDVPADVPVRVAGVPRHLRHPAPRGAPRRAANWVRRSRCTSRSTPSPDSGSRTCGSIRRTRSPACA